MAQNDVMMSIDVPSYNVEHNVQWSPSLLPE